MKSIITSKFRTTIPKAIREKMKLSVKDALEWTVLDGRIVVTTVNRNFLNYQNTIKVGKGDIEKDIELAGKLRKAVS